MGTQQHFDEQIANANTKLDAISTAITDEATQIRDFIAQHAASEIDTSALDGVVARLESMSSDVSNIFEETPETPETPPSV